MDEEPPDLARALRGQMVAARRAAPKRGQECHGVVRRAAGFLDHIRSRRGRHRACSRRGRGPKNLQQVIGDEGEFLGTGGSLEEAEADQSAVPQAIERRAGIAPGLFPVTTSRSDAPHRAEAQSELGQRRTAIMLQQKA